jgi:hypothetical protein
MNKLSIIILFLAITKYATANLANITTTAVLDASQSESSEDNEGMIDRRLRSKSKTRFTRRTPTSNRRIDSSAYSISVKVTDPEGIKKVWIETKYETEKYVSRRATKKGNIYKLKLTNLQEGAYTWRVQAKNKKKNKKRSGAKSFTVIRTGKWFDYRVRKWKAYSTFISDLTLYYSLSYCSWNPKQRCRPNNFESNCFSNIEQQC